MRLSTTLALLLLLVALPARAQIRYDTVSVQHVGPGMIHWQIEAPALPLTIDVLEVDLHNPYLKLMTVEANDLRAGGNELTTSMAARMDAPGHRVVGAVNGDFFSGGGNSVSTSISDGEIIRREASGRAAIGVTEMMGAFIARPRLGGTVVSASGSYAISGYNDTRTTDALILYNRFVNSTATNAFGTEVRVRLVEGDAWTVNDTVRVVVERVEAGVGNMAVPKGQAVLSGNGAAATFLQGVEAGDTLRVFQQLTPGPRDIRQLISGNPQLTVGGDRYPFNENDDFNAHWHPRTVLGFNADTTRFYFITADGRQATSRGISNIEMRDFLLRTGIANAVNLDGGGSTTMVVRGQIVNSPSGAERAVSNGFLAISTAPEGPLALIQTTPTFNKVFLGQSVQLRARGADAFYNPVEIDPAQVSFSVDADLGTVSAEGLFTAGLRPDTGFVYVQYGELRDSVQVIVKGVSRLVLTPEAAMTDASRPIQFQLQAVDTDGLEQSVEAAWISWHVTDTTVGTVSSEGLFQGQKAGTTQVVATYADGITDTATVRVEIGEGVQVLNPMDDPAGWLLLGENVDASETTLAVVEDTAATGGRGFHVHYRFTASATSSALLTLRTNLPIFGVPDSVNFSLRSDGARHRAFLDFKDHAGQTFTIGVPRFADDATQYALMPGPLVRANLPAASIVYPITLTAIRLQLDYKGGRVTGQVYEGDLYLDDLHVTYPPSTPTSAEDDLPEGPGAGFELLRNHPNPFTGTTTITYRAAQAESVRLVIYDVLGREVATAFDGRVAPGEQSIQFDASQLPSGVYFLRADGRAGAALKLVVLR